MSRLRVVLYNPQAVFYTMPLGLLAIGSALDPSRYDVRIIDGRLESDAVDRVLAECDGALCLGVTVLTGAPIADALRVLRAVRRVYPRLPTICGGWHPSLFAVEMLEEPTIDITVQGQGEATFAELVTRLGEGREFSDVRGLSYRDADGVHRNLPRPLLEMDSLPAPDYGLINVERYFELKGTRQLDYITSIGCPFRCAFCADPFVYLRGWKGVSALRLGEQVEQLWRRYQFTDLNFQDETFFTYRKRVMEMATQFIGRGLTFSWAATLRADQAVRLGEEALELCVKSGLRRVLIGVESGSPATLLRIHKDTTIEQVHIAADLCRRHGLAVIFSFIVGFPGESPSAMRETLDLVKRLRGMSPKFETPIFYYKPYPGSGLAEAIAADVPKTLEEWATFDYVQGELGQWVTPGAFAEVERFKFYNRHVWVGDGLWKRPLQLASRLRCRYHWFAFPVEKALVQRLRPEQELS
jgi:radical SAM superfamily enzyme YgiQ (UPF0313 family)